MVWREGRDHATDCYFCMTNLKGINRKNKHCIQYPDIPSAIKPVTHGHDVPVPEPNVTMESNSDSESRDMIETAKYLKVVGFILGLQGGYTKYPCFLCSWDSAADDQHYVSQEWPSIQELNPGSHNVVSLPLVEPNKILFLPLHIKLSLMKNFVKALDREGGGFAFLQKFQRKSMEKIKAVIFDGPQIRELVKDTSYDDAQNPAELSVWLPLLSVIANFLANDRCAQYQVVHALMDNFRLSARMSVKMHFLRSNLDHF
ncbi:hypothetical protein FHG87_014956 [Trinorchestia longiramus]|nr:hypothetical protein FHG87_014956 [Trinorchestia longiramus]